MSSALCRLVLLLVAAGWPLAAQTPMLASPEEYRASRMLALWDEAVSGDNLALGKPVAYAPSPTYHLTVKGDSDKTDLTDGQIFRSGSQLIWWEEKAVGWNGLVRENKRIILDLQAPAPVGRIVWRVVAGSAKRGFTGPKRVKLYGSLDGTRVHAIREYYRAAEDNARADNYLLPNLGLPEEGTDVYVYPLILDAGNYTMRYLILEFDQDSHWFCTDELAVLRGSGEGRALGALPGEVMQTADVWIRSPEPTLPLVADVMLPLWFRQTDFRALGEKMAVTYRFVLPPGITLHSPRPYRRQESGDALLVTTGRGGNSNKIGPFFFTAATLPAEAVAVQYQALGADAAVQPLQTLWLQPTVLPPPFRLRQLSLSIGWMTDVQRGQWPDFAGSYGRLGFNAVPSFPRGWAREAEAQANAADPGTLTEAGRDLAALRGQGFQIIYMESPLHVVNWRYPEAAGEYRCQLDSVPQVDSFCPTYRGDYFQQEVERVGSSLLLMGGADKVIWDCELLGAGLWHGQKCRRCQAAFAGSGIAWEKFVQTRTIEMLQQLNARVRVVAASRGWPAPGIGMYGVDAARNYAGMLQFPVSGELNFQNPSLYVGDDPLQVHQKIRQCRQAHAGSGIIPWLSTNTNGQVSPANARIILWEALLNGASGATYYSLTDFNPAQLVEICRALARIAPWEDILLGGTPEHDAVTVLSGQARHSAIRKDDQLLLLLVNPGQQAQSVSWRHRDGQQGRVELPPGEAEMLHVRLP